MPTIELTEEQIRADATLRGVLQKIVSNPEARTLLQRARKIAEPDAVIPELEATARAESTITDLSKKIDDFITTQAKDKADQKAESEKQAAERRMEEGFERLKQAGVTPEGLDGVKKIMTEEGILNPLIAWDHFEKLHPPATPVLPNGTGGFGFLQTGPDTSDDIKKLIESRGDSALVLDKMARDALNEVRGGSRR